MSKKILLSGVSAAAFALTIGGAAFAADVTVPNSAGTGSVVNAHIVAKDLQTNTGGANVALVAGSGANIIATGTGTTNTVNLNTIGTIATGNTATEAVTFNTIATGSGTGIGILNVGLNLADIATSTTTGNHTNETLTGLHTGTATDTNNVIEAITTLNTASLAVSPTAIPLTFASGNTGTIATTYPAAGPPNLIASTGDIAIVNAQGNSASGPSAGSTASLTGNAADISIGEALATTLPQTIAGTTTLSGNALTATYTGNSATNTAGATGGGLPTYAGSITVANIQANQDATGAGTAASALGNNVEANISGNATSSGSTARDTLTGSLAENSNSISASATGNSAAGTTTAGNSITLTGVNFADPGGQTQANSVNYPHTGVITATNGGLALLNSQVEESTGGTPTFAALNAGSIIGSNVQNATGATATLNTNSITSATTGDTATNAISVTGGDTLNGSAVLTSDQETNHQLQTATTTSGVVGSTLGVATSPNDIVTGTTASVNGNTIGATDYGASVANAITLNANSVTSGTTTTVLTGDRNPANGAQSFSATNTGSTINSVQAVFGSDSTVTSANTGALVTLQAGYNQDALTGDTLSLDSNRLQAIAAGTSGSSALSSTATSLTGGLGVLNAQTDEAAVTATLSNAASNLLAGQQGASVGSVGSGSTLDNSSNVLRALAYGNQATGNTITANAGSLSVAASGAAATVINVDLVDALGLPFDNLGTGPVVTAGLAVFSDQGVTSTGAGDITASNTSTANAVLLSVGGGLVAGSGSLINSTANADTNAFVSAARGNVATNGATITGNSIGTSSISGYANVASVANVQSLSNGTDVSSTTDTSSIPTTPGTGTVVPTVRLLVVGNVTSSTATADANQISAITEGNTSTNSLSTTEGSSIVSTLGPLAFTGGLTYGTGVLTNDSAFSVTNAQGSGTGNRNATLTDLAVHLDVGGNTTSSTLDTNTNVILASAADNTTTNTLSLDPPNIQAPAGVQNLQLSQAALNVTQGKAGTAAVPPTPGTTEPNAAFNVPGIVTISKSGTTITITGSTVTVSESGFASDVAFAAYAALFGKTPSGSSGSETFTLPAGAYPNAAFAGITDGTLYVNAVAVPASGGLPTFTFGASPGSAASPGTGIVITVGNLITASTLNNSHNTFNAAANANTANNTLTVNAGTAANAVGSIPVISQGALYTSPTVSSATGDFALQNVQAQSGNIVSTSNATNSIIETTTQVAGADSTTGSTLTLTGNQNQATSQGNLATSTIGITAVNSTGITAALLSDQDSTALSTAATANDTVSSNLLVSTSTVLETSNANVALAGVNTATNGLTAGGGASLGSGYGGPTTGGAEAGLTLGQAGASADYSLANVQTALTIGSTVAATATQSVGNSDVAGLGPALTTGSVVSSTVTLANNSDSAQATVNRSDNTLTLAPGATLAANAGLMNAQTSATSATGTATTVVSFQEPSVQSSTVGITGNSSSAEALGNVSTSTVAASGVNIALTGLVPLDPGTSVSGPFGGATADYALANDQATGGFFLANNTATFSLSETVPTAAGVVETTNSTLKVDANSAVAAAEANVTSNTLTIAATDAVNSLGAHAATGALVSIQAIGGGDVFVDALSTETVNATGMVSTSTVDMSANTNLALAVGNDATNKITATAVNYGSAGNLAPLGNTQAKAVPAGVSGDLALQNAQSNVSAPVSANAFTTISQSDNVATTGNTTVNLSTVTIDNNVTTAEADVNRASNALNLSAANTGALAGLLNEQTTSVSSTAGVIATIGYAEPNATTSTIAINGNSSTAQATGNTASNALNATASANYSIPAGSFGTATDTSAAAQFAVLNGQFNSSSDTATNTTNITLALNNGVGGGVVSGSTLSASNNSVLAQATGNAAVNSIGLTAAVTGTSPAALSSVQTNTGAGTSASVVGSVVQVTAGSLGGVTTSTLNVTGNTIVARATGNSVANSVTGH